MTSKLRNSIQEALGLSEGQLTRLIIRSPHAYKTYTIPKKTGGRRIIAQPAKETKYIQHWLINNIFSKLPIHECASAYKDGASIKKNAEAHQDNEYLSKFDFQSFFSSIKECDLAAHFTKHLGPHFTTDEINDIARISCIKRKGSIERCLSIGAPSSPLLSNTIMYDFDCKMVAWCNQRGIAYTRYADDLTFSTEAKFTSSDIEPEIRNIIRSIDYPSLKINRKKTIHVSKKCQRRVTGIIINNEGNLSLGRERKRMISSLIHKHSLGLLPDNETYRLQGLLGFAKDIEPTFIQSMINKYGAALIGNIFQKRK